MGPVKDFLYLPAHYILQPMPISSIYKPFLFLLSISVLLPYAAHAQDKLLAPQGLLKDLREHSNRTYTQGYQTNMTLQEVQQYGRDYQYGL